MHQSGLIGGGGLGACSVAVYTFLPSLACHPTNDSCPNTPPAHADMLDAQAAERRPDPGDYGRAAQG